ncbi:MAG: hypothetical protein AB1767_05010 [Bacillota bacterium]
MVKDWNIKNIYLYLVCLVTLVLFISGFISSVGSAMQILLPDQPNVSLFHIYYPEYKEGEEVFTPPPLSKLEKDRQERELQEMNYRYYTWRQLLNSLALMIIPIPFYLYHWKMVKPSSRRPE